MSAIKEMQASATELSSAHLELLPAKQRQTVLLADDEAIVRTVATTMLRRLGYDVLLAADGREALKLFTEQHNRIDLVILDLMLPDISGEQLYLELRRINPLARAMLITGYSESDALGDFIRAGITGFLPKPFDLSQLQQQLLHVMAA